MFSEVVAEYTSAVDGKLAAYRTDATSEPGNVLAFILFDNSGAGVGSRDAHSDNESAYSIRLTRATAERPFAFECRYVPIG